MGWQLKKRFDDFGSRVQFGPALIKPLRYKGVKLESGATKPKILTLGKNIMFSKG